MFGKRILLGITGGIAAYKIAYLIRILKKNGAEVKCIMTPASSDFISPLVVSTLSLNPVGIEFWNKKTGEWNNHVDYALWADVFVIAPATSNSIAKMANGTCDNLVMATYFSLKTKAILCPAMDLDMYQHPAFKRNLQQVIADGALVIPATSGELASGLKGEGRMEEPEMIASFIADYFKQTQKESSSNILITAGPTYEAIDPVRFIGNHSSGKMGFEIAKAALNLGHQVVLVTGPTQLSLAHPLLTLEKVTSAKEMLQVVERHWSKVNYGIFAAAVADYRPDEVADQKIKKKEEELHLKLVKNPDILKWASENRNNQQIVTGFALETNNAEENALSKLNAKKLDFIVLNTLEDNGAGFKTDTNKICILDKDGKRYDFGLKPKSEVALDILTIVLK